MGKHTCNNSEPVACPKFLSVFKKQLNSEGASEAGDLRTFPSFSSGEALELFKVQAEEEDANFGSFRT